ncbi:hypothetical protein AJ80_04825 [Polytolypa hystricis UAMH7299]|uniref:Low temperature requirement protein LtrA n=1 Tax=Polytolypa hystricis (strain UAMH7299) TaxID=1447883 RepID=A0A2B7Y844_POLH7|nr:hypothetical protein AJ80_04825 [Polytolypa hystricis UAMH7299]
MRIKTFLNRTDSTYDRRKPLPWIATPVIGDSGASQSLEELREYPQKVDGEEAKRQGTSFSKLSRGGEVYPIFRRAQGASPLELFYDLFFVANLGSFVSTHEINTVKNLASYVGYITLMWCIWLQVTLFDIRFQSDSVFTRVFKALHLGFMTGFAVLGPNFDTSNPLANPTLFRNISYVCMAVRLALAIQYASVAWYIRGYQKTFRAQGTTIGILVASAAIFFGLAFSFSSTRGTYAFAGWYVVSGLEAIAMISVSSFWRSLSFKGTPIVERFGGLTLIVLGEGVVGMTKAVTRIAQGAADISPSSVGLITAYVLIIYCIYMIYFDHVDENRFGSIRQQIWALLHYPLHIGILLTIEGARGWVLYDVAIKLYTNAVQEAASSLKEIDTADQLVASLKALLSSVTVRLKSNQIAPDFAPIFDKILALDDGNTTVADNGTIIELVFNDFMSELMFWIMKTFGVDVPSNPSENIPAFQRLVQVTSKFYVLYKYFFLAAGLTLVFLAIIQWFGKSHKTRGELVFIITCATVGIGLALVATIVTTGVDFTNLDLNEIIEISTSTIIDRYMDSGWIEPTVLLSYGLVVAIDHIIVYVSYRQSQFRSIA